MNRNKTNSRTVLGFLGCLGLTVFCAGPLRAEELPKNIGEFKSRALGMMRDITPTHLPSGELAEVTSGFNHASVGFFFGDEQMAALVALRRSSPPNAPDERNADLCLLFWDKSWNFVQYVGTVSGGSESYKDWDVKTDLSSKLRYLISRRELQSYGEHLSWLCDPKTHRLIPMDWPQNAIPSIVGKTITFTYQTKPGYSPTIRDIHFFNGKSGERIATLTEGQPSAEEVITITLQAKNAQGPTTWRIGKKSKGYDYRHDVYAISQDSGSKEETLVDFDWEGRSGYNQIQYLLWRLTGLPSKAFRGLWEQEHNREVVPPKSAKVTGSEEMIRLLEWPQTPVAAP